MKKWLPGIFCWGVVICGILFAVYVYVHNPFTERVTGCMIYQLTGLQCPGCGMTRAAWLLMHGHPWQALKMNPFIYVLFPLGYMVLQSMSPYLIGKKLPELVPPTWLLITLGVLLLIFTFVRNLPVLLTWNK